MEDKSYQADKKQKEQTKKSLVFVAMKSKYTKVLLDNMLLSPYEMTYTALMSGIQAHMYALYDELKDLWVLNGGKDH